MYFDLGGLTSSLKVYEITLFFAGTTLVVALLSYIFSSEKYSFYTSLVVYLLLSVMAGSLVVMTGGIHSSFLAMWVLISIFASVYGIWGTGLLLTSIGIYAGILFADPYVKTPEPIITLMTGVIPIIAGYILFHATSRKDKGANAYHELASELSSVSNKAEVVIRAIDDGVIALNSDGNIELMNPAAQHIIGWGNQDALGLAYASVLKLSDNADQPVTEATDPIAKVLATNLEVESKDFFATTTSGKRLNISLVISPIGQIGEGAIVVFRDITKELAEERGQAEFISTASHEMRTPVASIEGYLGLALNPNTAQIDDKARDFIEKAHASAQHLGRLFQDLLDVSKADDGRLSNHPTVIDIVSYVGEIVEGLEPKAAEKQLRMYYKPKIDDNPGIGHNLTPVFYANVDNDHLREVIANLTENAIKYTPKGDVIIDVGGDDEHVKISIQDSGIGIPREDIPHLFQKFYRVDNSATREIGGTGLGLYLCRRLAEMMGGRIWVESEFEKGSTFFLELPRISRDEAARLIDLAATQPEKSIAAPPQIIISHPAEQALSEPQATPIQSAGSTILTPISTQPQTAQQPPTVPVQQHTITIPQATVPQPTIAAIEASHMQSRTSTAGIRIPSRNNDTTTQP